MRNTNWQIIYVDKEEGSQNTSLRDTSFDIYQRCYLSARSVVGGKILGLMKVILLYTTFSKTLDIMLMSEIG
jgi:hypothetical protein